MNWQRGRSRKPSTLSHSVHSGNRANGGGPNPASAKKTPKLPTSPKASAAGSPPHPRAGPSERPHTGADGARSAALSPQGVSPATSRGKQRTQRNPRPKQDSAAAGILGSKRKRGARSVSIFLPSRSQGQVRRNHEPTQPPRPTWTLSPALKPNGQLGPTGGSVVGAQPSKQRLQRNTSTDSRNLKASMYTDAGPWHFT